MATVTGGLDLDVIPKEKLAAVNTLIYQALTSLQILTRNAILGSGSSQSEIFDLAQTIPKLQQGTGLVLSQTKDGTTVAGAINKLAVAMGVADASGNLLMDTSASGTGSVTSLKAQGQGIVTALISSLRKLLAQEDSPLAGASVHALTDGSDSHHGVDSLVGGGSLLTDDQASFITTAATNMGANTDTLADVALALKLLSKAGTTTAANLGIEVVRVTPSEGSKFSEVGLSFKHDTLLVSQLSDLAGATLAIDGMEKALLIGAGTARVDSGTGALLIGDRSNQTFIGGAGADTLIGGGGYDSLSGGGGADVFGFIRRGHYTITDFVQGTDKLLFEFEGINTRADVMNYLTGIVNQNGDTKFIFGPTASITLVGVTASTLFSDLLFDV